MPELRAPDPTLTAHLDSGEPYAWRVLVEDHVAHRVAEGCARSSIPEFRLVANVQTEDARWFAVPCRECFPDAPPPGHRWGVADTESCARFMQRDENLSWQVVVS